MLSNDLRESDQQDCLLSFLRELKPSLIHIALPCGTGSRARERPIPKHLLRTGAPNPRQLRDQAHPLGLPNLTSFERLKVDKANQLAQFAVQVLAVATHLQTIVVIENPARSWMWNVLDHYVHQTNRPELSRFWHDMQVIHFSNCAHGGDRPKNTIFRSNTDVFTPLAKPCPGNHQHKPYTLSLEASQWKFATV